LAAVPAALAGHETVVDEAESTQLRVWAGPHKPPLVLEDINSHQVRLETGDGSISVVHFFATWCEPCRAELPALDRLIARTNPSRLRVVAISVAEVEARVRSFIDKHSVKVQILLDRDRSVARAWKVHALPTTFILDQYLRPRLFIERDYDWDRFDVPDFKRPAATEQSSATPPDLTATPIKTTTTNLREGQP
jgi:peroxiredoxin